MTTFFVLDMVPSSVGAIDSRWSRVLRSAYKIQRITSAVSIAGVLRTKRQSGRPRLPERLPRIRTRVTPCSDSAGARPEPFRVTFQREILMIKGMTALVTGSTSGIGLGIAQALAGRGANIILHGFGEPAAIEAIRQKIAADYDVAVRYDGADLSKPEPIEAMIGRTIDDVRAID